MTVRYQRLLSTAASCLALFGALATAPAAQAAPATAQAAPAAAGQAKAFSLYPPSALVLSIGYGENTDTVQRAVMLRCRPHGGDHPNVPAACAALDQVGGDLAALSGEPGMCTREYRPVTVVVNGVWQGRRTSYRETFSNPCVLIRAKGPVFEF